MSGKVWMSNLKSNHVLGDRLGLRTKFYGHEWEPAEFEIPLTPDDVYANMQRAGQGYALSRKELPEAGAVWNEKRFKRLRDIFYAGGFLVVRGKLAEVLGRFDLGEGGLVPFPIYQADLETPYPGEFFLLNFGCRKDTVMKSHSNNIANRGVDKETGIELLRVHSWSVDGDVALSQFALKGPDLWIEERIDNKIFISDSLCQSLEEVGQREVFDLNESRIVGGIQ